MTRNPVASPAKHVSLCQKETTCCYWEISLKTSATFKTNLVLFLSHWKLTG